VPFCPISYLGLDPLLRQSGIKADADTKQNMIGKVALARNRWVVGQAGVFDLLPICLAQQVQDASWRKSPQHPPKMSPGFLFRHGSTLSEAVLVHYTADFVPLTSARRAAKKPLPDAPKAADRQSRFGVK
jgi:hypothetical protein